MTTPVDRKPIRNKKSKAPAAREAELLSLQADAADAAALKWLTIRNARHNNLKNVHADIPLGRFVCVTGVSGSGKSSLINDILKEALTRDLNGAETAQPGAHDGIDGMEHLDKVIDIDQSPIGRTPRSNPATYTKVFDEIRNLYAELPDSKVRGYKPGRFSFNVSAVNPQGGKKSSAPVGGRCEACEGNGSNRIEMDFLADVWVTCPMCEGHRFNRETLGVRFKGRSIADVLEMDVQQAAEHFANIPRLSAMLDTLHRVGLDYIKLGQPSTTLSGGEAQRIKLAKELMRRSTGRTFYILDEPTTGLHFEDVRRLLEVLHGFVDSGNTVLVVEHHLDVIKTADWLIDLGPEGGDGGGRIVACGTPEELARNPESHTGQALRELFEPASRKPAARAPSRRAKLPSADFIRVSGAQEHNLKNVSIDVPRNAVTVCSGVSGSGKSSFAIDTVYTEGHRRYVESLSAYARQFLGQLQKPRVDHIEGLSPAIAIEQKSASKSPRSTVGTVTEIYDYMRVLWARLGTPYCPKCARPVGSQTSDEITEKLLSRPAGTRLLLCAPIERIGSETFEQMWARQRAAGYVRVRIDGTVCPLNDMPSMDERRHYSVQIVVDRIVVRSDSRGRLGDSVEQTLAIGGGVLVAVEPAENGGKDREERHSLHHSCDQCGTAYDELTPNHFSFNSRLGWCHACEGLGVQRGAGVESIVQNPGKSLLDGALSGWSAAKRRPLLSAVICAVARAIGFDPKVRWRDLSDAHQRKILFGTGAEWIEVRTADSPDQSRPASQGNAQTHDSVNFRVQFKGFYPAIHDATRSSWKYRMRLDDLVTEVPCVTCVGERLRPESRVVRLRDHTIGDVCNMPLEEAGRFFKDLKLDKRQSRIAGELLREINARLGFLLDVGLDYLTLLRGTPTLSGGEAQRIRLASQVGSGLTGVLYVLDEPTIGLHPRDNARLIAALHRLRDLGNTLLMVEHDREVIDSADHVIDFGPGAGRFGGRVVGSDSPSKLRSVKSSITGQYLAGKSAIAVPTNRRTQREAGHDEVIAPRKSKPKRKSKRQVELDLEVSQLIDDESDDAVGTDNSAATQTTALTIVGARHHNLRNVDVEIPIGRFVCVTGVSGSGKSSLINDVLSLALLQRLNRAGTSPGSHEEIRGLEHLDKVVVVDQTPIGNSPLSNAATYTGIFDHVRTLFARMPESRIRGYTANRFSFNRPGGRCDACEGLGQIKYEMHFLPDVWVACETCRGARYNPETLEVRYRGKSISDVLEMTIGEAHELFAAVPKIHRLAQMLVDVGLDYMPLGQSAPTMSGGEAQRVKLAAELGQVSTGRTIYLLDEPTTGLHFEDLRKLLDVLHRLVDLGNTVVCVEHNLDVIKTADWIIDLGPEAGVRGGEIVATGTPEQIVTVKASLTGAALRDVLKSGPHAERPRYDPKAAEVAARRIREAAKREAQSDESGPAGGSSGETPKSAAKTKRSKRAAAKVADDSASLLPDTDDAPTSMPWERDGRRWHTQQRPSRDGGKVEWKGEVLEQIVEQVEKAGGGMLDTDWRQRACVEIKAAPNDKLKIAASKLPWFMHALTGGRWLLDLSFRVPRGAFAQEKLITQIGLKTLNQRDDLPIYGAEERVAFRPASRDLVNVRIQVHDMPEINSTGFKTFVRDATRAYVEHVAQLAGSESKATPWTTDGRAWHLSQKVFPPHLKPAWSPSTLIELLGRIGKVERSATADFNHKSTIRVAFREKRQLGRIFTNDRRGLKVELNAPLERFAPTEIESIGHEPKITRGGDAKGVDLITFWIRTAEEARSPVLANVVKAFAEHVG